MAEGSDAARDLLEGHPWETTLPLLVEYARQRMKTRWWGGLTDGRLPGGREATDVAYEAVEKVLSGTRRWDPAAEPDLVRHLKDVIESDLNHLAVGFENRQVSTESVLDSRAAVAPASGFLAGLPSGDPAPHEAAVRMEEEREGAAFADAFLASLDGDPGMREVVRCIFGGIVKPADIAAATGLPVAGIYNMRKRLQRRLTLFYQYRMVRPAGPPKRRTP